LQKAITSYILGITMTGEYISPREARQKKQDADRKQLDWERQHDQKLEAIRVESANKAWSLFEQIRDADFPDAVTVEIAKRAGKIARLLHPNSIVQNNRRESRETRYYHPYRVLGLTKGIIIGDVRREPDSHAVLLENGSIAQAIVEDSQRVSFERGCGNKYMPIEPNQRNAVSVYEPGIFPIPELRRPELFIPVLQEVVTRIGHLSIDQVSDSA
jgi:hypothetical protein